MTRPIVDYDSGIIEVGQIDIAPLKIRAAQAPLQRARICLHKSYHDQVQEMIIAFTSASYIRPHRHINKSESFHVIEGKLLVVFFDKTGGIKRTITMEAPGNAASLVYRMSEEFWHSVLPLSDFVVIHEVVAGPFAKHLTEFPDWAPADDDAAGIEQWLGSLRRAVGLTDLVNPKSPLTDYYTSSKLSPVEHDVSSTQKYATHEKKRKNLIEFWLKLPLRVFRGARVLEVGPGSGENALVLARQGARLTLVEPVDFLRDKLRAKFASAGLSSNIEALHEQLLENFETDQRFDVVIAEGFLGCLPNRGELLHKLSNCVDSEGFLFIAVPHPVGMFVEQVKAIYLLMLIHATGASSKEQQNQCAERLYLEDFSKIRHSRSFEAWVWDSLLAPRALMGKAGHWSFVDMRAHLGPDYYLYSSWPNYLNHDEFVWHKNLRSIEQIHQSTLDGYYARLPHFIDGLSSTDVGGADLVLPVAGREIERQVLACSDRLEQAAAGSFASLDPLITSLHQLSDELAKHVAANKARTVVDATLALIKSTHHSRDATAFESTYKSSPLRMTWGIPYHYCLFHRSDLFLE